MRIQPITQTQVINWTRHSQSDPATPKKLYLPITPRCENVSYKRGTFQAIHQTNPISVDGYHVLNIESPLRLFIYDNPDTYHTNWNVCEYYSGLNITPNLPTRFCAITHTIRRMDWLQKDLLLNPIIYRKSITNRIDGKVWLGFVSPLPIINQ